MSDCHGLSRVSEKEVFESARAGASVTTGFRRIYHYSFGVPDALAVCACAAMRGLASLSFIHY